MRMLASVERCEHWTTAHAWLPSSCWPGAWSWTRYGQARAEPVAEWVPLLKMTSPDRWIFQFTSPQLAFLGYGCRLSSVQDVLCKKTVRMGSLIL